MQNNRRFSKPNAIIIITLVQQLPRPKIIPTNTKLLDGMCVSASIGWCRTHNNILSLFMRCVYTVRGERERERKRERERERGREKERERERERERESEGERERFKCEIVFVGQWFVVSCEKRGIWAFINSQFASCRVATLDARHLLGLSFT